MKKKLFFLLLTFFVLPLAAGQILPGDFFSPGWKRSADTRLFKKADLFNHINGGAELFLEFGFEELSVQRYVKAKKEIALEVYRMESAASAFGVYLFKSGKETPVPGISARNSGDVYQFTILKGGYFIQVNNFSGDQELLPVMKALTAQVLEKIPAAEPVKLLEILPAPGRVPGTEALLRGPYSLQKIYFFGEGDILQLKGKVFAAAGDYRDAAAGDYTLLLVSYPDGEAAAAAFRNLSANLDDYIEVLQRTEKGFTFKDFRGKFGIVEFEGSLLRIKVNLAGL